MQKTLLAASFAAVLVMGGGAFAADVYTSGGSKDVYAAPNTWTGFHVGIGVGGGAVNHDLKVFDHNSQIAELNGLGGEGALGTVEVGYDRQYGRFVVGVFFNYDFTNIKTDLNSFGSQVTATLSDSWTFGGRAGYVVNMDTLVYVLGGYTQANFDLPLGLHGDNPTGYTVGGGIETKLGGPWSLKGEYRFTRFDTQTLFAEWCSKVTSDTDVQTGRIVLSYKGDFFGPDFTPLK
jgi:outer membrane immunogenic protein